MQLTSPPHRQVLVFDTEQAEQRPLTEAVSSAGFAPRAVASLEELAGLLDGGGGAIALLSFEGLWPQPQEKLRVLRERAPLARLIVVHAEQSPRLRLGQRLWSAGALDFLVSRALPHSELALVLRQAQAEASRAAQRPSEQLPARLNEPADRLRFLHTLSAAFANQRTVAGLLRELHIRLPALVPFATLQVYLPADSGFWVHQVQTRPLPHSTVWGLIERSCAQLSELLDRPIPSESLSIQETTALPNVDPAPAFNPGELKPVVVPMMSPDGLVGCLSLLVAGSAADAEQATELVEMISFHLATALKQAQMLEAAERVSLVDELTGAHNRRFLNQILDTEWKRSIRYKLQLSVAMIDVDHFKRVNDVYGHQVGDQILRALSELLRKHLRETDQLVRFGGEEFSVVMPETGPTEAAMVLERVRLLVASQPIVRSEQHGPIQVTFSAGVAAIPAPGMETHESLIREADAALYTAKRGGRDRVCISAIHATGEPHAEVMVGGSESELRHFPRIPTRMKVRYLEVPDFASSLANVNTADISAGGIAVYGEGRHFKRNAYGLVFLEDARKPLLTRVVWTSEGPDGTERAGLRYVEPSELDQLAHGDRERSETLKALVIARNPDTRNMVGRVLRAARYEITYLEEAQPWPQGQALESFGLIVVGDSSLRDALGSQLELQRVGEKVRIVVINEGGDRKSALDTLLSHQVRHLVAGDESSDEVLFATLNKLLLGEYFGIRKYLAWGAQSKLWEVSYGDNKAEVLAGVRHIAAEVRCHPRIADLLVMAVDEMIINALYRAPPSEGSPSKPVSVECGSDGRLVVVSVLDEHGRFKAADLYAGLGRALEHQEQGVPADAQHANLGFRIMLDALSQLAINVSPGKATEIIGIVDLRKSLKAYRSSVPTFNMFSKE